MPSFGSYPGLSSTANAWAVYKSTAEQMSNYDISESSPEAHAKKWADMYRDFLETRLTMLEARQKCSSAVLKMKTFAVKPQTPWTTADSRDLVNLHKSNGTWVAFKDATWNVKESYVAYRKAARSTLSLASNLALHDRDQSILDVLSDQLTQLKKDEGLKRQVTEDAIGLASGSGIEVYNALDKQMKDTLAFYDAEHEAIRTLYEPGQSASAMTSLP